MRLTLIPEITIIFGKYYYMTLTHIVKLQSKVLRLGEEFVLPFNNTKKRGRRTHPNLPEECLHALNLTHKLKSLNKDKATAVSGIVLNKKKCIMKSF